MSRPSAGPTAPDDALGHDAVSDQVRPLKSKRPGRHPGRHSRGGEWKHRAKVTTHTALRRSGYAQEAGRWSRLSICHSSRAGSEMPLGKIAPQSRIQRARASLRSERDMPRISSSAFLLASAARSASWRRATAASRFARLSRYMIATKTITAPIPTSRAYRPRRDPISQITGGHRPR